MRFYVTETVKGLPLIDLLSGNKQIFQGDIPSLKPFLVKTPSKADLFLVPHDAAFWSADYARKLDGLSSTAPLIFFNRSDLPLRVKIPNSYSLQNSILDTQFSKQIIIPYNTLSLEHLQQRRYAPSPAISFVGFVPKVSLGRIKTMLLHGFPHSILDNPIVIRRIGLRKIQKHFPNSKIIVRSHYGGARSLIPNPEKWRMDYESSIANSDLVFCPRGDGNASQRFYEAISCGRVPLVPNTSQILPRCICENPHQLNYLLLKWSSDDVMLRVREFWTSLNSETYQQIQSNYRRVFAECLNYKTFLRGILSSDFHNLNLLVENPL